MIAKSVPDKFSIIRSVISIVALEFLALMAIGGVFGKTVFETVAVDLIMPPGILFLGISTALLHCWRRRLVAPKIFLVAVVWLLFTISSNGIFANWLMSTLEKQYMVTDPFRSGPLDAVVLLDGDSHEQYVGDAEFNARAARLMLAAALFHQGVTKLIVSDTEADGAQLIQLNVPADAIRTLNGRHVFEELRTIQGSLSDNARFGVVASARHMERVTRLARNAKLDLFPLPTDFRHESTSSWGWARVVRECVPNEDALELSTFATTEYLARFFPDSEQ